MLSAVLKEQTLSSHQQLEKKIITQIKAIENQDQYAGLLKLFYSYFGGLEELIKPFFSSINLADYAERRKAGYIKNDIEALGHMPDAKASGGELPQINSLPQAFGALYVIEGSTLGGTIISGMIGKRLNNSNGLTFFNGYGEKSGEMWGKFLKALNTVENKDESTAIAAANETFKKFSEWIDNHR